MPLKIEVKAGHERLSSFAEKVRLLGEDWLPEFQGAMIRKTDETFDELAHGGSFRGVTWPWFKRTPPARRGGAGALLLQDTGRLRREAAATIFVRSDSETSFGTLLPYAAAQQKMRPFLFFELPGDAETARDVAINFLRRAYKESNS